MIKCNKVILGFPDTACTGITLMVRCLFYPTFTFDLIPLHLLWSRIPTSATLQWHKREMCLMRHGCSCFDKQKILFDLVSHEGGLCLIWEKIWDTQGQKSQIWATFDFSMKIITRASPHFLKWGCKNVFLFQDFFFFYLKCVFSQAKTHLFFSFLVMKNFFPQLWQSNNTDPSTDQPSDFSFIVINGCLQSCLVIALINFFKVMGLCRKLLFVLIQTPRRLSERTIPMNYQK